MRRLSLKQKKFTQEYIKTGNGTQSALAVYDTSDPLVAHAIASENLQKPSITEEIDRLLRKNNFTLEENIAPLQKIATSQIETRMSADQVIKASELLLRLRGADRGKQSIHTNITLSKKLNDSNFNDLIALHKEKSKEIEEILGD